MKYALFLFIFGVIIVILGMRRESFGGVPTQNEIVGPIPSNIYGPGNPYNKPIKDRDVAGSQSDATGKGTPLEMTGEELMEIDYELQDGLYGPAHKGQKSGIPDNVADDGKFDSTTASRNPVYAKIFNHSFNPAYTFRFPSSGPPQPYLDDFSAFQR